MNKIITYSPKDKGNAILWGLPRIAAMLQAILIQVSHTLNFFGFKVIRLCGYFTCSTFGAMICFSVLRRMGEEEFLLKNFSLPP